MKHTVVVGISSGIAAYKIIDLIKILKLQEVDIFVIMTQHAREMISYKEFEKVTGNIVYTTLYPEDFDYKEVLEKKEVEHINLADSASLFVVSPATANVIGKIAGGIADDFLTTTLLAATCPVLICPSMNVNMWNNPLVAENLKKLKNLGYYIFPPDKGQLACGYEGVGRLANPEKIASEILQLLNKRKRLQGKKIIVTAGATSEPFDAVRVITNRASGKMGKALAEECFMSGAEVLLLRAKNAVSSDYPIKHEVFETFLDLEHLMRKYIGDFDVLFHTAAVSDFQPEPISADKIDSRKPLILRLKSRPKIIDKVKAINPKIKLIGFKAVYKESEKDLITIAMKKLKESQSDYLVVNDVGKEGIGFAADENEVYIISTKGLLAKIEKTSKKEVARKILEYIFPNFLQR